MLKTKQILLMSAAFAALAATATATAQEPLSRETGVLPVTLKAGQLNSLGLPFIQPPVASGQVTGIAGPVITDSGAALGTLTGPHSFWVTKGEKRGKVVAISSNAATTITLSAAITGLVVGDEYEIVPDWTLNTLIGSSSNPGGLTSAFEEANSDIITLFDDGGNVKRRYFSDDLGYWVDPADGLQADKGGERLNPNNGLLIKRVPGANITFLLQGAVRQGRQLQDIHVGFNLHFHTNPEGVTLNTSGWFTGNSTTGVLQAFEQANADEVRVVNSNGSVTIYYYSEDIGAWTSDGSTDAGATAISAGTAVILKRNASAPLSGEFLTNRTYIGG